MNIKEINNSSPRWSAVLLLGIPMAAVTVAIPLGFNFWYRKILGIVQKRPMIFYRLIVGLPFFGCAGFVLVALILGIRNV